MIAGATAVGKTAFAIRVAQHYKTAILSADSRQFYKEMTIGTAAPTEEERQAVPHFFVGNISISDYYSISRFEQDVLKLLPSLFEKNNVVVLTGGSGLYIDAVCKGIDDLPDPDLEIRENVIQLFENQGISALRQQLKILDPTFYNTTDIANHKRLMRALEVCLQTGRPYSSFLSQPQKTRDFDIVKWCLTRPREELNRRIERRVDAMIEQGLVEEARNLYPYKDLNALNTVGYKELFDFFDEKMSFEAAVDSIKTHTKRYAKRQITWFKRDSNYQYLDANNI